MKPSIAIVTDAASKSNGNIWPDDAALAAGLSKKDCSVSLQEWRSMPNPLSYDAIFVSTLWDIIDYTAKFIDWLKNCEADGKKRLINDGALTRDNFIKSNYLNKLAAKFGEADSDTGSVTPSRYYAPLADTDNRIEAIRDRKFEDIINQPIFAGNDIVLKPIISADGRDTFVFRRNGVSAGDPAHELLTLDKADAAFEKILNDHRNRGVIVQQYIKGIEKGEYSIV